MNQKNTKTKTGLPSACTSECEQEYEIAAILGSRIRNGNVEYLIHWRNCDVKEDSWEPVELLRNSHQLLREYLHGCCHCSWSNTDQSQANNFNVPLDGLTDYEVNHSFLADESDVDTEVEDTESRGAKKRKVNFTKEENAVLLNAIRNDGALLLGRGGNHKERQIKWSEVTAKVNAIGGHDRVAAECRRRVMNMQYRAKEKAREIMQLEQSGKAGTSSAPTLTEDEAKLLSLLPGVSADGIEDGRSTTPFRLINKETLQRACSKRKRKNKLKKQDTTESEDDVGQRIAPPHWNPHLILSKEIQNVEEESTSQMRPLLLIHFNDEVLKQPCRNLKDAEQSCAVTLMEFSTIPLIYALFLIAIGAVLLMYIL